MKFLFNTPDPSREDAPKLFFRQLGLGMTDRSLDEWNHHKRWLENKFLGEPLPTGGTSVRQLKDNGMVGVYSKQK